MLSSDVAEIRNRTGPARSEHEEVEVEGWRGEVVGEEP